MIVTILYINTDRLLLRKVAERRFIIMTKPDYDLNSGTLSIFNVHKIKNLEIKLKGQNYEFSIPKQFLVQTLKQKNVYAGGVKTKDAYIQLQLIDANVAKTLAVAGQDEAINNLVGLQCNLPVGYVPKDQVVDGDSIVELDKLSLLPKWVDDGHDAGYKALRGECQAFSVVGSIHD